MPSPAANATPRPADPEAPPSPRKTCSPTRPYTPARDLIPHGWSPVFETVEELGLFVGRRDRQCRCHRQAPWHAAAAYGAATAGQRDPEATRIAGSRMPRCLDSSPRPGGSSSASNPVPVSCCVSNASAPPLSASSFRGRRFDEPRPSSRASRSRIVIAKTPATSARYRAPIRSSRTHARWRRCGTEIR